MTTACTSTPTTQRPATTQHSAPSGEGAGKTQTGSTSSSRASGDHNPGREGRTPPSDFGGRNPDFNGDGHISEHEAKVYEADTRAETAKHREDSRREVDLYREDARTKVSMYREKSANYRAEVAARTEQMKSNNDNKLHKLFGINPFHSSPPAPEKPH